MIVKIYMSEKYDNKVLVRGITPGNAHLNVEDLLEKGITKLEDAGPKHYPPHEIEKLEVIPGQDYSGV